MGDKSQEGANINNWISLARAMLQAQEKEPLPEPINVIKITPLTDRRKNKPQKRRLDPDCPIHGHHCKKKNAFETFLDTPLHVGQPTTPKKIRKISEPMTVFHYDDGSFSVRYDVRSVYDIILSGVTELIVNNKPEK